MTSQRPRFLIEEYVKLIAEFGLDTRQVYDRSGVQLEMCNGRIEPVLQADVAALPISELELAQGQALINAERRERASMTG